MASTFYPPEYFKGSLNQPTVFLAGTIDMGLSDDWQSQIIDALHSEEVIFLNPRRKDWDNSWKQSITHPKFREQVEWELDGLEAADLIVLYLAPSSKSPISLLELGLHARSEKIVVCCPDGFWRKGNVDIVCNYYNIKQVDSIEALILEIHKIL